MPDDLNFTDAGFNFVTGQALSSAESTALRDALGFAGTATISLNTGGYAAPTLRFGDDANSGFYRPAADRVGYAANGQRIFAAYISGLYMEAGKGLGVSSSRWWRVGDNGVELATTANGGTLAHLVVADVVVQSPDGTLWRLSVDNSGTLTPTAI